MTRNRGLLLAGTVIVVSLALTSSSSLQLPSVHAQSPPDVAKALERFLVKIFPFGQTGGAFAGSGVVVRGIGERTLIATTLSVAARLDRVTIVDVVGGRFDGAVSLRHAPTQLALISVNSWTGPRIVDVDARSLRDQETLVVLGFDRQTGGGAFVTTRAASRSKLADEMPQGFEGGPVVGLDQRILGLVASLQGEVIPSARILEALTALAGPGPGLSPTPVPSAPLSTPAPTTSPGGLAIRSFPSGAEVSWAGQPIARTPTAIERRSGVHPLRFGLANHSDVAMEVTVSARTEPVYVVLPPLLATQYGRTPFARNKIRDGSAALAAGDSVNAARLFRQALDSDYTLVELRVYVGLSYFLQGRLGDALSFMRDFVAVKNSGRFAMTAFAVMGLSYERQGRFQDALTRYKLALRLHPAGEANPSYRLGIAHEAKGRFREGMQAFKDALFALGPP